jgi:Zn-dependent peptidase ImmA (M78 family)
MRKPFAKKIDESAANLLRQANLLNAPVDVRAFARQLGARVVFENLEDDVSGFLLRDKGVFTIAVNQHHHPNRQRFTLAHECGHLHLHAAHGDRLWLDKERIFFRDSSSSKGEQRAEIEANQFAAGLLMPEELIRLAVPDSGIIGEVDLPRFASRFEVSERAMTFRLISLDLIETVAA